MRNLSTYAWIIGWSLLVHVYGITSPLLDYHAHRQCQTASMARNYVRHGLHFLDPEVDTGGPPARAGTEFPIYSYLLALLYVPFGVHEILGRLLSCLFAAWGAIFLYQFIQPRLGERLARWSALVMCAIPVHVYFTRTVQPEPMALWGFLGFLVYLDRWLNRTYRTTDWFLAVILGALGPLLKLPFLYLVFPMWMVLGYERLSEGKRMKSWSYYFMMPAIVGLTLAWYQYTKTAPVVQLPLGWRDQLANLAPILKPGLWENHFISRFPELCTTYSGLLFFFAGIFYFRKAKTFRVLLWWWLTTAVYIVLLGDYGLIHRYTELPWAPVNAVFIAAGISALWEHAQSNVFKKAVVAVLVLGIPVHSALRIKHWYRVERLYLFRARSEIAAVSRPTDLVLTNTRETPVLLYYLDHYGYAVDLDAAKPAEVDRLIHAGSRFFLTPLEPKGSWERHPEWSRYFAAHGRLIHRDPEYLLYELAHH